MTTNNVFTAPAYANHSPKAWYELAKKQTGFIADPAQEEAIDYLDRLWQELMAFKKKRNRFLGRTIRSPLSPKGLYFWGGVGRGKSFLMDAFYGCLPYKRKRRVHFHAFMSEVHQRLAERSHEENPLNMVANDLSKEVRVLCFDEFHVSDIADAMILGRLLEGLFQRGVVMVATSNFAPDDLYYQGQNRSSFLQTIALIKKNMTVVNVDGGEDHRLRTLKQAPVYYVPNNESSDQKLKNLFEKFTKDQELLGHDVTILGRPLTCIARTREAIWFDFQMLCFGPRSQNDYLYLAKNYKAVFISNITALTPAQKSEARRLTWLIDVFYDYRVKMAATADVLAEDIYTEGDFANEFVRTVSRMVEMQSESYLDLPHLTLPK